MDPDECADLLRRAIVLARIRKDEHRRLGGIYTHHKDLYERMLGAAVGRLPSLGRERYRRCDVELAPQPTEPARVEPGKGLLRTPDLEREYVRARGCQEK